MSLRKIKERKKERRIKKLEDIWILFLFSLSFWEVRNNNENENEFLFYSHSIPFIFSFIFFIFIFKFFFFYKFSNNYYVLCDFVNCIKIFMNILFVFPFYFFFFLVFIIICRVYVRIIFILIVPFCVFEWELTLLGAILVILTLQRIFTSSLFH